MLSARLVQMIEDHADELTRGLVRELQSNPRTPSYHRLSREEIHHRGHHVYSHLGQWLGRGSDELIEAFYGDLGRSRYREGIPLSEVIYALALTKYHLRDYIRSAGLFDSAVELYQEQELHRLVGSFFDRAMYHTARGFEEEAAARQTPAAASRAR